MSSERRTSPPAQPGTAPVAYAPAGTELPPGETPLSVLIIAMALVAVPLIAISQVISYWRIDVVDDQMFGYFGWRIASGAVVYRDVWDNKPPGIYWVNALGMLVGAGSYFGVIAMCTLALVVAHAAFFIGASAVFHRGAAALATILLSFYLTHAYYTGGTNRTETFLVAAELTGVALYLHGFARNRWWMWFCAGAACGVAFLFKQVGLAAWGCMGLHLIALMAMRQDGRPGGRPLPVAEGVRRGVLLTLGAGTIIGLAAAVLAAQGVLHEAIRATFLFNRAYFAAGDTRFPYSFVNYTLLAEHVKPILLLPLLMAAAGAIHAFLWWLRPQFRPPEIEGPLRPKLERVPLAFPLFAAWFLVALYGALVSPHGFRHYIVAAIPPLMFMAGYLINVLRAEVRLVRQLQRRAWVTVAFVLIAYFAWEAGKLQFQQMARIWLFRIEPWLKLPGAGPYDPSHWEVVGKLVADATGPDDRIQCWGFMPGVYLEARRINACRYATTEKVGQVREHADDIVAEIEECVRRRPPELLVISDEDWTRMEQGHDSQGRPSAFTIAPWIKEQYRRIYEEPRFGTIYIFKRKDLLPPEGA
ncbi:MAG: glycosyltransferase family 39 protein [Planctomycetota bacterium]